MEHVWIRTIHTLALVLMAIKGLTVMVSSIFLEISLFLSVSSVSIYYGSYTFSIFLEINPACSNITCHNGGSCAYINETTNNVCECLSKFAGEYCEGITFRTFSKQFLQRNIICVQYTEV